MIAKTKKEITNSKLALMIGRGFEHMDKRFDRVENRLIVLEKGHEDIRLRQDQMAYRFELNEVKKRVDKVERKLGLANH